MGCYRSLRIYLTVCRTARYLVARATCERSCDCGEISLRIDNSVSLTSRDSTEALSYDESCIDRPGALCTDLTVYNAVLDRAVAVTGDSTDVRAEFRVYIYIESVNTYVSYVRAICDVTEETCLNIMSRRIYLQIIYSVSVAVKST